MTEFSWALDDMIGWSADAFEEGWISSLYEDCPGFVGLACPPKLKRSVRFIGPMPQSIPDPMDIGPSIGRQCRYHTLTA